MKFRLQIVCAMILIMSMSALGAVPQLINAQGRLTQDGGGNLPDGSYPITFTIYDAALGGVAKWSEINPSVTVSNGQFNVLLGSINPILDSVFSGDERYLAIKVGSDPEMTPRSRLVSVGYAQRVGTVDGATGGSISGELALVGVDPNTSNGALFHIEEISSQYPPSGAGGFSIDAAYPYAEGIGGKPRAIVLKYDGYTFLAIDELGNPLGKVLIGTSTSGPATSTSQLTVKRDFALIGNDPGTSRGKVFHLQEINSFFPPSGAGGFSINAAYPFSDGIGGKPRAEVLRYDGNTLLGTDENGNPLGMVGIGTRSPSSALDVNGTTSTCVLEITGGCDLAEPFEVSEDNSLKPGDVVIIDETNAGKLKLGNVPYDSRVAGIVSGGGGIQPGLTLRQEGVMEGTHNVALSGRVYVRASACNGSIKPGDLLTTSSIPGCAMKVTDRQLAPGATIGKAMSALEAGEGLVLVLVNLQ